MSLQTPDIDEQLERANQLFRLLVELASGWPCVIAPYNGPAPANQYCSVWIKSAAPEQHDIQKTGFNEEGNFYIDQKNETYLSVEIKAMGANAKGVLNKVISKLKSPERWYGALQEQDPIKSWVNAPLWQYLGFGGHDNIQDISTEVLGKILPQAVVTVYFYANLSTVEVIEGMTCLDISVTLKDNEDDIFTVNIGEKQNVDSTY